MKPQQDPDQIPGKRPVASAQDYLDLLALRSAEFTTPSFIQPGASEAAKEADRQRRLAALSTKHRRVFSAWPRDPDGKAITPEDSKVGKMTPSAIQFWGATLFDFFQVRRIPSCENLVTISTGSKLLAWMKEQGETYAGDQMARAELEASPKELRPYPVTALLRELRAPMDEAEKGDVGIVFGRGEPFSRTNPIPILQEKIPFHLLPQKLIIHDPFGTLSAAVMSTSARPWTSRPDILHAYRLQLSETGLHKAKTEQKQAEIVQEYTEIFLKKFYANPTAAMRPEERGVLVVPQGAKAGPCVPAVYFMHGAKRAKRPVEEAHLYLTPSKLCGQGNHSIVYNAEWEVPRYVFADDIICKKCVYEKGMAMLKEEDGPNGENQDPKWRTLRGNIVETHKFNPGFAILAPRSEELMDEDGEPISYELEAPSETTSRKYEGPVRIINTGIEYQTVERGPLCEHLTQKDFGSPTARVLVVAKMSVENDNHLEREMKTYQDFPEHLSTHWTGYNVLPPLVDPFPAGAVVPNFYGYYVPDEAEAEAPKDEDEDPPYRSPILLMENCGQPIPTSISKMCVDDREECASLFYRLHHAGWVHGSAYPRNILCQPGPVDAAPFVRQRNATKRPDLRRTSFRLVDFGRTERVTHPSCMAQEETEVATTFQILHYAGKECSL